MEGCQILFSFRKASDEHSLLGKKLSLFFCPRGGKKCLDSKLKKSQLNDFPKLGRIEVQ